MRKSKAGHIYVLEVSDGTIKVGYAGFPAGRLEQHVRDLSRDGREILRNWISPKHAEASVNEETLITSCVQLGGIHHGPDRAREWFSGLQYGDVVEVASHLPLTPITAPLSPPPAPHEGNSRMSADEARRRWRDLLDEAQKGETAEISRNGKPIAALVPIEWFRNATAVGRGVHAFTHDADGNFLPGETQLPVGELRSAIGDAAISELEKS